MLFYSTVQRTQLVLGEDDIGSLLSTVPLRRCGVNQLTYFIDLFSLESLVILDG